MTTVGQVGLGYWGKNLVRNFDELGVLTWLCDQSEELRTKFAGRYPSARVTGDFDDLLNDASLDASGPWMRFGLGVALAVDL